MENDSNLTQSNQHTHDQQKSGEVVVDKIHPKKKKAKKKNKKNLWPIKAFFLTLTLSAVFSFFSEITIMSAHIVVAVTVLLVLIGVSIVFDMIAVAMINCPIAPFTSMCSKKIKGAKASLKLLQRVEVVSSVCADVIGDVCGIISGAAGTGVVFTLLSYFKEAGDTTALVLTIAVSSLIAALTVSLKAACKLIATKNSQKIVFFVGRALSIFKKEK